jgi:hypothetical protein
MATDQNTTTVGHPMNAREFQVWENGRRQGHMEASGVKDAPTQNQTTGLVARLRQASKDRELPMGISLGEIPKVWPGLLELEAACEIERQQVIIEKLARELATLKGINDAR